MDLLAYAVAALIVAIFAGYAGWQARARRGLRRLTRCRALVTLKTGAWFAGVLETDGPLIVVRNAKTADAAGEPLEIDGELVIFREDVDYVQLTGGDADA